MFDGKRLCRLGFFCGRLLDHSIGGQFDRPNEAVTLADDGLDETWPRRIITQRRADFADVVVNAALGIEEEVLAPDSLDNFFPRDKLALLLSQQDQKLQWLPFQANPVAGTAQFEPAGIQLEIPEAKRLRGQREPPR